MDQSYTGPAELGIPDAFDMTRFGSSASQDESYLLYSSYGCNLPPEEFSFQGGSPEDQSYYDCIRSLDDHRADETSYDLQVPQHDAMQKQPSNGSNQTTQSYISLGLEDQQASDSGHSPSNSLDIDTRSASKAERRRAQNREAQRAFRTRRNYSLQMASQKLRDSLIEIRGLRHQKEMYGLLAQQQAVRIRELEKELELVKARCVCRIWEPSMASHSIVGPRMGGPAAL